MDAPTIYTDDEDEFSYRRLLDYITEQKELIVTIKTDEVDSMKKNLATLKSRDMAKLKNAGLEPGNDVLSYDPLPCNEPDCSRIHIKLGPRKGVKILKMELPDNEL